MRSAKALAERGTRGTSPRFNQRVNLQNGVPVARGAARAERSLDDGVGQFRAADAVGVHEIDIAAGTSSDLAAGDGGLQRLDLLFAYHSLQTHRDQVRGIALRLVGKRILRDDGVPFVSGSHEEADVHAKPFARLCLEQRFDGRRRSLIAAKYDVAALQ